jgi:hypothetical protein
MKTDPIPVWKFFEIPPNGIEICLELAKNQPENSREKLFWHRAADFLENVKSQTTDQLVERDFDWILKLRVLFEKDEEVEKVKSRMNNG